LLRRVGDLDVDEVRARSAGDSEAWLATLAAQWRAVPIEIAGTRRWIAAEDAGVYRDALGVAGPEELPPRFLGAVAEALPALLRRYAHARGSFTTSEVATRYRLTSAQTEPLLRALEAAGTLVHGALAPGGTGEEWCDADVWRQLKRRTLAKLRNEI